MSVKHAKSHLETAKGLMEGAQAEFARAIRELTENRDKPVVVRQFEELVKLAKEGGFLSFYHIGNHLSAAEGYLHRLTTDYHTGKPSSLAPPKETFQALSTACEIMSILQNIEKEIRQEYK